MSIDGITGETYHEDSTLFGSYQYVSLVNFVDNFMAGVNQDSYINTTTQSDVILQTKRGIRIFSYDFLREIKAIEIIVTANLTVTLPQDYVSYIRISMVDDDGFLRPLVVDYDSPISRSYLQDNNLEIVFDGLGEVVYDEVSPPLPEGNNLNSIEENSEADINIFNITRGFLPNLDLSKVNYNGSVSIDKNIGILTLSSDIETKSIVIEYYSDGLGDGSDIKIHKLAEQALTDYVYYYLIRNRRNVPANEIARAKIEYDNSARIAKRALNPITPEIMRRISSGDSKWIKGS